MNGKRRENEKFLFFLRSNVDIYWTEFLSLDFRVSYKKPFSYLFHCIILSMSLKFDTSIACPLFPFPASLWRNDADRVFLSIANHPSCLPPFVVWCICDVQDITMLEWQSTCWQSVVTIGIVIKECSKGCFDCLSLNSKIKIKDLPNIKRSLLWCP